MSAGPAKALDVQSHVARGRRLLVPSLGLGQLYDAYRQQVFLPCVLVQ